MVMRKKVLLRNDEEEALKVMELGLKLAIEGRARLKRVSCLSIIAFLLLGDSMFWSSSF